MGIDLIDCGQLLDIIKEDFEDIGKLTADPAIQSIRPGSRCSPEFESAGVSAGRSG